jgi:hypothetical protein
MKNIELHRTSNNNKVKGLTNVKLRALNMQYLTLISVGKGVA